jgi:hypothetical protein
MHTTYSLLSRSAAFSTDIHGNLLGMQERMHAISQTAVHCNVLHALLSLPTYMHIQKEVWMLMQTSKYHLQAPFKSQARRGRFFGQKKDHISELLKRTIS